MIPLPRVGWRLLACGNGASGDCIIIIIVVVVVVVSEGALWVCMSTTAYACNDSH